MSKPHPGSDNLSDTLPMVSAHDIITANLSWNRLIQYWYYLSSLSYQVDANDVRTLSIAILLLLHLCFL